MPEEKKQPAQNGHSSSPLPSETSLTSVSSSLALMFLKKHVEKGNKVDIPSLDIRVEKKNSP